MISQDIAREKSAGIIAGISASSTFQVEKSMFSDFSSSSYICNFNHILVIPKAKLGKTSHFSETQVPVVFPQYL